MNRNTLRQSLRLSATLLLLGQLLYIVITLFHTGGEANNHPAIFAAYAASGSWVADHVGQFVAMALLIAGLLTRISAGALGVVMIVAVLAVQWPDVDSLLTFLGLEEVMYLALFLWLAIAGAGPVSIDHALERRDTA